MPTSKDISGWLREAETLAKIWRNECIQRGLPQMASGLDRDADKFHDRAAIVEKMRCKTCEWWTSPYGCKIISIMGNKKDFSCCHWEGRCE
jgi:hypothetical protein